MGIFGGTFDPIHFGHLRIALELLENCALTEIRFIPCKIPVHKASVFASSEQRVAMLRLAVTNQQKFIIDDRELIRDTASYTIFTLESLKKDFPEQTLCLIMGLDALANFHTWHRWQDILTLSHIIAVNRPDAFTPNANKIHELLQANAVSDITELKKHDAGKIYFAETALLTISSTEIRKLMVAGKSPQYLLPNAVLDYINLHKIYMWH